MRFKDESFIYRIMGIDNGSTSLGIVVADLDLRQDTYHVVYSQTLQADKLLSRHSGQVSSHGAAWVRQNTLKDHLSVELQYHRPHAVAVETPFFMPGRVQSFRVLSEMMIFIRQAVDDYGLDSDIIGVSPGQAKKAVQVAGFTMKKAVIPECVRRLDNVTYKEDIDKHTLSEHEYDAIAVIVSHGKTIRKDTGFDR